MTRITVRDAAERAGVSDRLIYKMLSDGRLTKYVLTGGRSVRIDPAELDSLFVAVD